MCARIGTHPVGRDDLGAPRTAILPRAPHCVIARRRYSADVAISCRHHRICNVGDGVLDVPCRQSRICNFLRIQCGHGGRNGWFCLRRVTFLCRQESHQRSDSGGGAGTACLSFPFWSRSCLSRPTAALPLRTPSRPLRVSLLRGGRVWGRGLLLPTRSVRHP